MIFRAEVSLLLEVFGEEKFLPLEALVLVSGMKNLIMRLLKIVWWKFLALPISLNIDFLWNYSIWSNYVFKYLINLIGLFDSFFGNKYPRIVSQSIPIYIHMYKKTQSFPFFFKNKDNPTKSNNPKTNFQQKNTKKNWKK